MSNVKPLNKQITRIKKCFIVLIIYKNIFKHFVYLIQNKSWKERIIIYWNLNKLKKKRRKELK